MMVRPAYSCRCETLVSGVLARHLIAIDNSPAIYRIVQLSTGRFYIGSTVNARGRLRRHFYDLQSGSHHSPILQRAWSKYGLADFSFEIIEYVSDRAWILFHEQSYIDRFFADGVLFNTCLQAGNCAGVKKSAETIRKHRERMIGRSVSAVTCEAISLAKKGRSSAAIRVANIATGEARRFRLSTSNIEFIKCRRIAGDNWTTIGGAIGINVKALRREVAKEFGEAFLKEHSLLSRRRSMSGFDMWIWASGHA